MQVPFTYSPRASASCISRWIFFTASFAFSGSTLLTLNIRVG